MYVFALLIAINIFAIKAHYDSDNVYTIRPAQPGRENFALYTGVSSQVTLQEYRQREAYELFHFEYSCQPGLFYLVVEPTG